eukprot:CAMPEP_0116024524 /NCGR_PEP_ID=MMETSP0321-20121206/12371_1 /TAXON_ID=163516 /ORGANISM="Leptocylindrus danicus var. danicus, Strain B650" /LENGTH=495 /DNA_ID=CAMNT_0003496277 /DNA_START=83 /DNA_END=1570 /DNA_ORIENTATION=-
MAPNVKKSLLQGASNSNVVHPPEQQQHCGDCFNNNRVNDNGDDNDEHANIDMHSTSTDSENNPICVDVSTVSSWVCKSSKKSRRTVNPIRAIVDPILSSRSNKKDDGKEFINLSLGDPTIYGNLNPPDALLRAAEKCASSPLRRSYVNACGSDDARLAIAAHHSTENTKVDVDDVIIGCGCSGALELALTALLDEGSSILVPSPGFPLYQVIAQSHGATVKPYRLDPKKNWECDLEDMEALVDESVRAIIVTNPSNPCGSVFSEKHLENICHLAARYHVPLVSDEVYGGIVFGDCKFHPLASISAKLGNIVPVITASGLAKQFLCPGWRVGWLVIHDNECGALSDVKVGIKRLAQISLGASHLAQGVLPAILNPPTADVSREIFEWKLNLNATLSKQSMFLCDRLISCQGLGFVRPEGAMYAMVEVNPGYFDAEITNDIDFTKLLLDEENLFALPGSAFGAPNFFRIVYCSPVDVLDEAVARIERFCWNHQNRGK